MSNPYSGGVSQKNELKMHQKARQQNNGPAPPREEVPLVARDRDVRTVLNDRHHA